MDQGPALLKACLEGEARSRDDFVDYFAPLIYSAVRRILHPTPADPSLEVDDVAQDVFLKLFQKDARLLRSYDPDRASLSTWLTVIARSRALDVLRRRHPTFVPFEERHLSEKQASPVTPAEPLDIPKGLLSTRERLVVELLFERGWDTEKAARLMAVTVQTVRSHRHNALNKLRAFYKGKVEKE
jgi:RNA polymerase sigma-70 factor (ECF subfamily)